VGLILGVDIGGTFTDCIILTPGGEVQIGKALSTPPDFHTGFTDAIGVVAGRLGLDVQAVLADTDQILHGCTVGSNALVERRTAKVGLLTSRGHRDSIFTMQSGRRLRELAAHSIAHVAGHTKPEPLVPKHLVREIDERVTVDGRVLVELDLTLARETIADLLGEGVEALAISLLWSVANGSHEQSLREIVRELAPDLYLSTASDVVPRTGEYERTVATVVNSLIGPGMDRYLSRLEDHCQSLGYDGAIGIMTCTGGLISTEEARQLPLLTIGSGPVAGLIGAQKLASSSMPGSNGSSAANQASNVITADMGGTTLDVGVIQLGVPLSRPTSWYDQFEYAVPTLDVRSVGSGGGSIIRYDQASGTLRVGPQSAGSTPGPVCYGRGGTEPTVADADLIAGFLNPDYFLGGNIQLDVAAAHRALAKAGEPLGLSAEQTASAALRIVDNQMADAIRLVSVNQGLDPREFALYACGGAGPVHAAAIAAELGIGTVVVPLSDLASGWSAFGVARAEPLVVEEVARPMRDPFDPSLLNALWRELEQQATGRLVRQGVALNEITLTRHADIRYSLQVNQIEIDAPNGDYSEDTVSELIRRFEHEYTRRYGQDSGYSAAGFAITGLRVRGRGQAGDLTLSRTTGDQTETVTPTGRRQVLFHGREGGGDAIPIYDHAVLGSKAALQGPAIVELPGTSIVVPHQAFLQIDSMGSAFVYLAINTKAGAGDLRP
jgi:N-methylhydantoinase A